VLNADLRRRLVELAYHWQAGHIPSALSVVDIIEALYSGVMRYRPHDPAWPDRDYFILSKGHGALALYAVLEKHGILSLDLAKPLPEHPEMGIPGVEAATGSLGHGLPMAVGILVASGLVEWSETDSRAIYYGELGLDGQLRHTNGGLLVGLWAKKMGLHI